MTAGVAAGDHPGPGRRRRIVEAAIEVFAVKGAGPASVLEIAAAAGVPRATVYEHFGSKEGLLAAAVAAIADQIGSVDDQARALEPYPGSIVERVAAVFRWIEGHPSEARLLYVWSRRAGPDADRALYEMVERRTRSSDRSAVGRALTERVAVQSGVATVTAWLAGDYFPPGTTITDLIEAQARVQSALDGRDDPPPPLPPEQRARALPPDERVSLVLRVLGGESPSAVALQAGIDAETLSRWVHDFIEGGRQALSGQVDRCVP